MIINFVGLWSHLSTNPGKQFGNRFRANSAFVLVTETALITTNESLSNILAAYLPCNSKSNWLIRICCSAPNDCALFFFLHLAQFCDWKLGYSV